ncbi:IclR family transcriptional regulator [Sneathiella sp.]|uniref:IclR family transcriptional regulator n=1 Tax=Sneathiella sp. TaxID=1964365 RepID=UPI0035673EA8
MKQKSEQRNYTANSLVRGLQILKAFEHKRQSMTLSEIADVLGVSSSAAYRIVFTLEQEGYICRSSEQKQYRLTSRIMGLGYSYIKSLDINEIAVPHVNGLRDRTNFSVHVSVLENTDIVYIHRALSDRTMVSNIPVGSRLPAYATSMGRLLLSDLPKSRLNKLFEGYEFKQLTEHTPTSLCKLMALLTEDRSRGFVAQNSHIAPGTYAIAAPLINEQGKYIGAINLSGHEQDLQFNNAVVSDVVNTAEEISRFL